MAVKEETKVIAGKIEIAQVRRQAEDIQTLRTGLESAENVKLPRRGDLYRVYKEIILDARVHDAMTKRIRAITNKPIKFISDGEDQTDMMEWVRGPWFSKLGRYIMEAKFWGHSLIEPILVNGMIDDVELIDRAHVVPELGIVQLRPNSMANAIHYRDEPYKSRVLEVGGKKDLGLLLQAAPYAIYKRGGYADWATFCELFGMPIRVFNYNPHDPDSREQAKAAADAAGAAAYIILPEGVNLELQKGTDGTGSQVFKELITALNDEITILFLGQNLTTSNSNTGTEALGTVHEGVMAEVNLEDMLETEYVLNWNFKDMLAGFGYPVEKGQFKFDTSIELPIEKQLEIDLKLSQRIAIPDSYFYDKYGIPMPGKNDPVSVGPGKVAESTGEEKEEEETDEKEENGQEGAGGKKPSNRLTYFQPDACCHNYDVMNADYEPDAAEQELLQALFDKDGRKYDRATWQKNRDTLVKSLSQSFGKPSGNYDDEDHIARAMMEANLNRFGYDKNLAQVYELNQILKQKEVKTFNDFKKQATPLLGQYNKNYLRTEYNFAVGAAQLAASFTRARAEGAKYARFRTVGDDRVRAEHARLDGMVFRLSDPQAMKLLPPLGYGCRCDVEFLYDHDGEVNTYDDAVARLNPDYLEKLQQAGMLVNRGELKEVFLQNQMYTEKLLQAEAPGFKLTDLKELGYELNGLQSWKDIQAGKLPKISPNTYTLQEAREWFTDNMNDKRKMIFRDVRGYELSLDERVYSDHLVKPKYVEENRAGLARYIQAALGAPDEIYLYEYKAGKYTYRYIRHYEGVALVVDTEITGNMGIRITTWYDGSKRWLNSKMTPVKIDKDVRKGLLVYGKR